MACMIVGGEQRELYRRAAARPRRRLSGIAVRYSAQPRADAPPEGAVPFRPPRRTCSNCDEARQLGLRRGTGRRSSHRDPAGLAAAVGHPRPFDRLHRFRARAWHGRPARSSTATRCSTRSRPALPRAPACRSPATSTTASSSSSPAPLSGSKRSSGRPRPGRQVGAELDELKRLLVEEQGEIRGFLLALRRDRELELADAVAELRALAERLASNGRSNASVSAEGDRRSIPIRLQLDLQQMLREAVANAVRHGGADRIDVGLAVATDRLQMSVADNGSGFAPGQRQGDCRALVAQGAGRARPRLDPRSILRRDRPISCISLPLAGAAA